jgi:murein DD-endopeptidase MepM/ murein hydrolase activator NlpD
LTSSAGLFAQLPTIDSLELADPLFRQHQDGVQAYFRRASAGEDAPPLLLYAYEPKENETLFGIAARLTIPYSALATVNRLDSPSLDHVTRLIVPSYPGMFVPVSPRSDFEYLVHDLRQDTAADVITLPAAEGGDVFRFLPGADFLPAERRAFLGTMFRYPVENVRITSRYGTRIHPMSGLLTFHSGIDLAAPTGTPVVAAAAGVVADVGFDEVMGNYVLMTHSGGFETFYGHLETTNVTLNQEVASGMILGTVGDTGLTTGAHLHFEIRHNGETRDPLTLLP